MIIAKSTVNEATMQEAWEYNWRSKVQMKWTFAGIGTLLLFSAVVLTIAHPEKFSDQLIGFIFGTYLLLFPKLLKFRFRKSVRKMPMYQKEITWTIDEEKVRLDVGGNTSENKLSSYFLVRITPKGILLYPQENIFYWIPRSGFASNEDFIQAVSIFKLHTKWKESK